MGNEKGGIVSRDFKISLRFRGGLLVIPTNYMLSKFNTSLISVNYIPNVDFYMQFYIYI